MKHLVFWVYMALSLVLLASVYRRMCMMSREETALPVIRAFQALGTAALVCIFAPFLWGYEPDFVVILLLFGVVVVQVVTGHYWRDGTPRQFKRRAPT